MGAKSALPSWNDGAAKAAILDYVARVTKKGAKTFVPPEARIAVFDNDGTLWCEKPLPIQVDFLLGKIGEQAAKDATLRNEQPWNGVGNVHHKPKLEVFDDGTNKVVRIWSRIGARPIVAAGNSNGDLQMMEYAAQGKRPSLCLLVNHDDNEREIAYTAGAEKVLEAARARKWTVVSVKSDWKTVFPR